MQWASTEWCLQEQRHSQTAINQVPHSLLHPTPLPNLSALDISWLLMAVLDSHIIAPGLRHEWKGNPYYGHICCCCRGVAQEWWHQLHTKWGHSRTNTAINWCTFLKQYLFKLQKDKTFDMMLHDCSILWVLRILLESFGSVHRTTIPRIPWGGERENH